jgi:hypothetical protein
MEEVFYLSQLLHLFARGFSQSPLKEKGPGFWLGFAAVFQVSPGPVGRRAPRI